ncbi:MAG: hypothetical protein KatS3mg125_0305 [Lysobacterales bacterium]|jgi:RND family efflux transporter MFP subunit|nr:MAG: hypothetical protein KatS3mg125_0305 [Xanthomonadales bacterium]
MRRILLPAMLFALTAGCAREGEVVELASRPVEITLRVPGSLESSNSARLTVPSPSQMFWNFSIERLLPDGARVRRGQTVVAIDTAALRDRLRQVEAELEQKRSELTQLETRKVEAAEERRLRIEERRMQAEKARRKAEQPEALVPGVEYRKLAIERRLAEWLAEREPERSRLAERAEANAIAAVRAEIERKTLERDQIQRDLEAFELKAPRDGMVVVRTDFSGEKFSQNSRVWPGQTIAEIPDLSRMVARVEVPERHAGRIAVGMPARIVLDADPDRVFAGTIRRIHPTLRQRARESAAMVIDAEIAIEEPDPSFMRPGMSLVAEIVLQTLPSAIVVPARAVRIGDRGASVELAEGLSGREQPVRLGPRIGDGFLVLQGLAAGQRVRLQ